MHLATGEIDALRPNHSINTVRKFFQNIIALGQVEGTQNFFSCGIGAESRHIFQDGHFEQTGILKNDADPFHPLPVVHIADIHTANIDGSFLNVPKSCDQISNRTLAAAGLAYQSGNSSLPDGKGNIIQGFLCVFIIGKGDMLQLNVIALWLSGRLRFRQGMLCQNLVNGFQRCFPYHQI